MAKTIGQQSLFGSQAQDQGKEIVRTWVKLRQEAESPKDVKSTPSRVELASKALSWGYNLDAINAYLNWVFKAPADWPKFMRKPSKPYLGLDNLLRKGHLRKHVPAALEWKASTTGPILIQYGDQVFEV